ncbi:amidohydrolase [Novosphingobium resinovorum]|uniref:Deaminase n=2 Tax=Novosphingobium resinovorum TaxID=158500 RepID=A0A031K2A8_9SPHN|nr:amidohydrolase [Novosphingobium resinovorum]EZP83173.1 Deaminase [Novosphingobium resinovorum]
MMDRNDMQLSRRGILAAALVAGAAGVAAPALAAKMKPAGAKGAEAKGASFLLRGVTLETGYRREGGEVIGTETAKASVLVRGGKIAAILPADAPAPMGVAVRDAKGMLLLPSFRDMHIHLDKTFYGGPWVPPRKRTEGIRGQIKLEQTLLPQLLPTLEERAGKLVDLLQSNGTTFARSQCNVDPVVGTKHVELLKHALDSRADGFGHEIVAFPQHGFVSADLIPTMRAAMAAGATHVGGIDPTALDGGMEKSVDAMMQVALDMDKGVDIHLHEPGASGIAAIRRIADTVEREPELRGKVTLSHAFSMMSLPAPEMEDLAARLAALDMSVASTLPFGTRMMPIPILLDKGVKVYTGTDSVEDHWSVFGSGDVLEKAKLACQLYGWSDEYTISQSLKIATGGPTPLDAAGKQVWPKAGDAADMVLVPAACSAEAVARQSPRKAVFHAGNLVSGALDAA